MYCTLKKFKHLNMKYLYSQCRVKTRRCCFFSVRHFVNCDMFCLFRFLCFVSSIYTEKYILTFFFVKKKTRERCPYLQNMRNLSDTGKNYCIIAKKIQYIKRLEKTNFKKERVKNFS